MQPTTAKMSKQDEKWQAEADARTLAEAEAIKADEKRFGKAQDAVKRLVEEEKAKLEGLKAVIKYDKSPDPIGVKQTKND